MRVRRERSDACARTGKHRVGCVVACIRRMQHWSLAAALDEYRQFAGASTRIIDCQFVELFNAPAMHAALLQSGVPHSLELSTR